MNRDR